MGMTLEWLEIGIDDVSAHAAAASFVDLFAAYESAGKPSAQQLASLVREHLMARCDLRDIACGESANRAATGATVLKGFELDPGDAYLEFFAALARHADADTVGICHGWPRLAS